jgi:tetratricopeptide (TPR) repeat protein
VSVPTPVWFVLALVVVVVMLYKRRKTKPASPLGAGDSLGVTQRESAQPGTKSTAESGILGGDEEFASASSSSSVDAGPTALASAPLVRGEVSAFEQRFHHAAKLIALGDFDTGFEMATEVLAFARSKGHLALSGAALSIIADVHRHRGDLAAAQACSAESLAHTRRANPHPWVLAISVGSAAETAHLKGDFEEAERRFREALDLIGTASEHPLYLMAVERLAQYEFQNGHFLQAKRLQGRALEFHEARGNDTQAAGTLRNIGLCERALGNFAEARDSLRRYHDRAVKAGDFLAAHIALGEDGITCATAGDHESALTQLRQSLDLQESHQLVAGGTIARMELCRSLLALNRPLEALAEMQIALEYPTHQRSKQDDFLRANCYAKAGQLQNAVEIFEGLLERSRIEQDLPTEATCLGNLGYFHRQMGHLDTARTYIQKARELHRLQGDAQGEAEDVRQLAAIEGRSEDQDASIDERKEQFDFWDALLVSPNAAETLATMLRDARAQSDPFLEFNALDGLGVVARNKGALEDAVRLHEQALTLAEGMEEFRSIVPKVVGNNNLGIVYRVLGDFDRARECYQSAIASARVLGTDNPLELMPRANLAKLYLFHGNPEAAKRVYLDEPRTIVGETDVLMDLDVRIGIFEKLRDTAALIPALQEMAEKCSHAGLIDRQATAYAQLGHARYRLGELSEAISFYDRALTLIGSRDVSKHERADILYFRSLAKLARRDYTGAYHDATESVRVSDVLLEQLALESTKRFARIEGVERCAHVSIICGHLNRIPEALEYLERSRSRLLRTLLSARRIEPSPNVPEELMNRFRELQTERRRLDLLIIQEQDMPLSRGRLGELFDRMASLRLDWEDTVGKIAFYDPVFEQFRDAPIRYEQIEALIPNDRRTALVEFCVTETCMQIVLVVAGQMQCSLMSERLSHRKLSELLNNKWFGALRRLRVRDTATRQSDLEGMDEVLGELYSEIFSQKTQDDETLAACLARCEVERLLIVPHGLLHLVPLHALWRRNGVGRRYLIDDFEVVYTPSCGVLRYCMRDLRDLSPESLVAFADPDSSLPGARNEVAEIRRCFAASNVFTGAQATVDAVVKHSATSDVLHFACHGSFDSQSPLSSYLAMADGRMTLNRIFEEVRTKPGALVTLSACETGMVFPDRTDEYVGLPSGFLFAGSSCVIGSLWPVHDTCTATVMKEMYAGIINSHNSPAASLRAAQRSLKLEAAYAHPYYWAAFQVVGSGWLHGHGGG